MLLFLSLASNFHIKCTYALHEEEISYLFIAKSPLRATSREQRISDDAILPKRFFKRTDDKIREIWKIFIYFDDAKYCQCSFEDRKITGVKERKEKKLSITM